MQTVPRHLPASCMFRMQAMPRCYRLPVRCDKDVHGPLIARLSVSRTLSETAKNLLGDVPWSAHIEEPLEPLVI